MRKLTSFLFLAGLLFTTRAHAFPENIRHGYQSCTACHMSPTGGLVLSAYGRQLSGELVSHTSSGNEAGFAYGSFWGSMEKEAASPIRLQANIRHAQVYQDRKVFSEYRSILMQADAEAAYTTGPWTFQAMAGIYGSSFDAPSIFVRYELSENLSFRAGRFFSAYGILLEDHRASTRRSLGYDQGEQTFNLEALYQSEWGEVFLTPILGKFFPAYPGRGEILGIAIRPSLNVGKTSQIGLSYQWNQTDLYTQNTGGIFALVGISPSFYLLSEVDVRNEAPRAGKAGLSTKNGVYTYTKVGWEFIKGYHAFLKHEIAHPNGGATQSRSDYYGLGFRILPRPHININFQAGARLLPALSSGYGFESVLMLHFYL